MDKILTENQIKCREYYFRNKEKRKEVNNKYYHDNKKICAERHKKYRDKNPEKMKELNRKWAEGNKEKKKETFNKWREKNRDKQLKYMREYSLKNKEILKEKRRVYNKNNREKVNEIQRKCYNKKIENKIKKAEYHNKNKERVAQRHKDYRRENKDKIRIHRSERKARVRGAEGNFTKEDIDFLYNSQKGNCISCPAEFKKSGYHIDHIIPLVKGGTNYKNNLQLLCPTCNNQKHAKDPIEFMQQKGFLL